MQLDHIGIAVNDLDCAVEVFSLMLGLKPGDVFIREVPAEKVRIAEIEMDGTNVELMEPTSEDSPISGFLAKRGHGVHHICFRTGDIDAVWADMKARGARTLSDDIRSVGRAYRYFFVHPKDAAGILTEFKQPIEGH